MEAMVTKREKNSTSRKNKDPVFETIKRTSIGSLPWSVFQQSVAINAKPSKFNEIQ